MTAAMFALIALVTAAPAEVRYTVHIRTGAGAPCVFEVVLNTPAPPNRDVVGDAARRIVTALAQRGRSCGGR